jgi:hypothetical protein
MSGTNESVGVVQSLLFKSRMVAYARFGPDGQLKDANPRFLSLIGAGCDDRRLPQLVVEGQREEMERLLREREPSGAPRNLHFAEGIRGPITLLVTWEWDGGDLVLLGEAPADDLEATQAVLLKLNSRVSELARENTKKSAALEKALADLRSSHWHLRRLKELLPICSYCGKVRTGEDYWQSVEAYLAENADFLTHGVCPECLAKLDLELEESHERHRPGGAPEGPS